MTIVYSDQTLDDAYNEYQNEDFYLALIIYSRQTGYDARIGEGSSAYKLQDYKHAIKQFTLAFIEAKSDNHRSIALFNLANSFYKSKQYIKSIETYKYVLKYASNIDKIESNLWSAQSMLIDELKKSAKEAANSANKSTDEFWLSTDPTGAEFPEQENDSDKIIKIDYLRTLIGDRVAKGELIALAEKSVNIQKIMDDGVQSINYLSALKKLEFISDNPETLLKEIIKHEK